MVARTLAQSTNIDWLDTDLLVEQFYERKNGAALRVRDIYRLDNGETFRTLEAQACRNAAELAKPTVVATGGGLCDNAAALGFLAGRLVVALESDAETLFERIMRRGMPPYLSSRTREEAEQEFRRLHARRSARYREIALFTVDVVGLSPDEIAMEVLSNLEFSHGRK